MPRLRLWYVNLFVSDLERAIEFYERKLGLPLRFRHDEFGYAAFGTEGAGLSLARVERGAENFAELVGRHTGVGLGVPDIHAAHAELAGRGVEFTMPPTQQPWGGMLATFRDPDGNVLYLDQLRAEPD
jgi:predicted enzyme related to lactoylglutathione lyase